MACCLAAPSHYLSSVKFYGIYLRALSEEDQGTNQLNKIEDYIFKIASRGPSQYKDVVLPA